MKIKVIKKRKKESKTQNSNQLELSFIDSSKKKNKNIIQAQTINSISRIFLSSLVLVSFFYVLPILINFTDNNLNTKEYTNNSKKILAYTLNKKNKDKKESSSLNEEELLLDIFSLNNLENDSVRLNASTIKQLFEDTGYDLNDVRKKKLVKPVALTLLPQEIKMIENSKKRKEFFIQIVLPLIIEENNNIKLDRKTLFTIINKSNNSNTEKKVVRKKI